LEKFPPTSRAIRFHIYRAHLQAFIWYHAAIEKSIDIDPEMYGYKNYEDELAPIIVDEEIIPESFPMPCNCKKSKSDKICVCRSKDLPCSEYCKCGNKCFNARL